MPPPGSPRNVRRRRPSGRRTGRRRRALEEAAVQRGVGVLHDHQVVVAGVGPAGECAASLGRSRRDEEPRRADPALLGAADRAVGRAPVGVPAVGASAVAVGRTAEPTGPGLVECARLLVPVVHRLVDLGPGGEREGDGVVGAVVRDDDDARGGQGLLPQPLQRAQDPVRLVVRRHEDGDRRPGRATRGTPGRMGPRALRRPCVRRPAEHGGCASARSPNCQPCHFPPLTACTNDRLRIHHGQGMSP